VSQGIFFQKHVRLKIMSTFYVCPASVCLRIHHYFWSNKFLMNFNCFIFHHVLI